MSVSDQMIGGVADEGDEGGQLGGRYAETRFDASRVVELRRLGTTTEEQNARALPGSLQKIAAAAHDEHLPPRPGNATRERRQHVVRLETRGAEHGHFERLEEARQAFELLTQRGGRARPTRLVLRVALGTKRPLRPIQRERELTRALLAQDLEHERGKPVERGARHARGRRQRR